MTNAAAEEGTETSRREEHPEEQERELQGGEPEEEDGATLMRTNAPGIAPSG
jgi:hypothetical protein